MLVRLGNGDVSAADLAHSDGADRSLGAENCAGASVSVRRGVVGVPVLKQCQVPTCQQLEEL